MGGKALDLTGERFFRLTVLNREYPDATDTHHTFWRCRCDCGNEITVRKDSLLSGHAKSCGCYLRERYHDGHLKTHGMKGTRLYRTWQGMKSRCSNPNETHYKNYGGRGIKVCDEWLHSFENFRDWALENGYADNLSIDRIDTNGNYEPSNCRWATDIEQGNNKRNNRTVIINGEELRIREVSERYNIPLQTIRRRVYGGITDEKRLLYRGHLKELK